MSKTQITAGERNSPRPQSRIVYEGRSLSPEDIADDAARRADAYSHPDSEHVAVVDGFGARVVVERGHLELHDGVGEHRRVRRYAKVDAPRRVVVGIGTVGAVSFDALRWCSSVGTCSRGTRARRCLAGRRASGAGRCPLAPSPSPGPLRADRRRSHPLPDLREAPGPGRSAEPPPMGG